MKTEMAAPSLYDKLREVVKEQDNLITCCHGIASDIQRKNLLFLDLIEKLGFALTDPDPQLRGRGTQVLAGVLQNVPSDFLQEDELHYISNFFCDRFKDHHSVIPAVLQGILVIVAMKNLPGEAPVCIMTTMFREISCQSQLQGERRVIYKIINSLTLSRAEDLKKMGPDLVAGVIQFIDGERDPRNLLFLFSVMPSFVEIFPLGHLTEEMFDVISCYFPVDFSPPLNDPNAVKREDLANSLAHCLVASPSFAEFCFPLLMEKLDSSVRVAKLDALLVLEEACHKFSLKDMETHLKSLWKSLLREIIPGTEKDVQDAAIVVLRALIHKLSADAMDKDQSKLFTELLTQTIGASQNFLSEVDSTLFVSAAKMLLASAGASSFSCHFIVTRVLPELIEQCLKKPSANVLSNVLLTISNFLEVCVEVKVDITEALPDWSQCLPGLFLSAANDRFVENGRLGMEGWRGLTLTVPLLTCSSTASLPAQASPPSQEHVYQLICQTLEEVETLQIRNSCMECLKAQAKYYPKEVMELIIKKLISEEDEQSDMNHEDVSKYLVLLKRRWSSMCELACCVGEPFASYVIPKVISAVINLSSSHGGKKSYVGISSLKKAIELAETNQEWLYEYLNNEISAPEVLIKWWLSGVISVSDVIGQPMDNVGQMFEDCGLLYEVATVISLIVRSVSSSVQAGLILRLLPLFFHWSILNKKCLEDADLPTNFKPLDESSPWQQTQTVILVEALIGSLRREHEVYDALSNVGIMELFEQLLSLAIFNVHPPTRLSSSRLLGSLINKIPEEMHLTKFLADLKAAVTPVLEDAITPDWQRTSSVKLHVCVTKALLLRGHEDSHIWIERLIGLLGKEKIGLEAALGFQEIMSQSEGYLNSDCHAHIRILFRQRFYLTLPKLVESYQKASLSTKGNFLLALAHLMSGVPRTLLLDDLPDIIPLLVESLKRPLPSSIIVETVGVHDGQEEKLLLTSTLETLNDLLMSLNTTLSEHLQTFIPKLLNIACSSKHMEVRQKALKCVYHLTKYPTILLMPYKYIVIKGLAPCLDDPKRLVRRDAVKARCQWFLVGSPG